MGRVVQPPKPKAVCRTLSINLTNQVAEDTITVDTTVKGCKHSEAKCREDQSCFKIRVNLEFACFQLDTSVLTISLISLPVHQHQM